MRQRALTLQCPAIFCAEHWSRSNSQLPEERLRPSRSSTSPICNATFRRANSARFPKSGSEVRHSSKRNRCYVGEGCPHSYRLQNLGVTLPPPEGNAALVLASVQQHPNLELRQPYENPRKHGTTSFACVMLLRMHISDDDAGVVQSEVGMRGLSRRFPVKVSAPTTRLNPKVHRLSRVMRGHELRCGLKDWRHPSDTPPWRHSRIKYFP